MYCFGSGGEAIRQLVDGYVSSNLSLLCFVVGGFARSGGTSLFEEKK